MLHFVVIKHLKTNIYLQFTLNFLIQNIFLFQVRCQFYTRPWNNQWELIFVTWSERANSS